MAAASVNALASKVVKGVFDKLLGEGQYNLLDADARKEVREWVAKLICQHDKKIAEAEELKKEEMKAKKRLERINSPPEANGKSPHSVHPKSIFYLRHRKEAERETLRNPKVAKMTYKEQNVIINAILETKWKAYMATPSGAAEVASYEAAKAARGDVSPSEAKANANSKFGHVLRAMICSSRESEWHYFSLGAGGASRVITKPKPKSLGDRVVADNLFLLGSQDEIDEFCRKASAFNFESLLKGGSNYQPKAAWRGSLVKLYGSIDEECSEEIPNAADYANTIFSAFREGDSGDVADVSDNIGGVASSEEEAASADEAEAVDDPEAEVA
jgi:hypothetical protein